MEGDSPLDAEATILAQLSGKDGFPNFLFHGPATISGVPSDVLVMELLGASLLVTTQGLKPWTSCMPLAPLSSPPFEQGGGSQPAPSPEPPWQLQ